MDDEALREMFEGLGSITIRRMFGGKSMYHEGLIVGIVLQGEVMLKGDEINGPEMEAAGAKRWVYDGRKKKDGSKARSVAMPYWTVPDAALDDPEEMAVWTRKSFEAALRTKE